MTKNGSLKERQEKWFNSEEGKAALKLMAKADQGDPIALLKVISHALLELAAHAERVAAEGEAKRN